MIQPIRSTILAAALPALFASAALGQRTRGTMGAPPPAPTPMPAPSTHVRGTMGAPMGPSVPPTRAGDLPRIQTAPGTGSRGYIRTYQQPYTTGGTSDWGRARDGQSVQGGRVYDNTWATFGGGTYGTSPSSYSGGRTNDRDPRARHRAPYTRWGTACRLGCFRLGARFGSSRLFGSVYLSYPFAVPLYVPFYYGPTYVSYSQAVAEDYPASTPAPAASASKLIVVGAGTAGGGDALTVETVGDSVRLRWLAANRPAREVTLFVADSAQRRLATRLASPVAPAATFEVATLAAPVAFAGVEVTFADGVISTTVVPYRAPTTGIRR